jgi:hypothetical protein
MVSAYDLVVEMLSIMLGLSIVYYSVRSGKFFSYLFLNLYVLANVAFTLGCYYVRNLYGYDSFQYYYFYYAGDPFPNILAYVLIGWFFDRLLKQSAFHQYVRPTLIAAFLLIVVISARFLSGSLPRFHSEFVFEFQQNIYFVGVLLTLLLWISMSYLQVEGGRFTLMVSGLGVYFATHAVSYAVRFLFPILDPVAVKIIPLAYNVMLALWLYALVYVSESEAALVSARELRAREDKTTTPARAQ